MTAIIVPIFNKCFSISQDHGLHLKRDKCEFMKVSVDYLGYRIDAQGLHPVASKVKAIVRRYPGCNQKGCYS